MLCGFLLDGIESAFSEPDPRGGIGPTTVTSFTGVRFSLYPNVALDGTNLEAKGDEGTPSPPSLKEAVKTAVSGIPDLGLRVQPDDVSSVLLGPEPALFEAVRIAFARAAVVAVPENKGKQMVDCPPRHVSMQCTFSAGCPGEDLDQFSSLPERTATDEMLQVAQQQPSRIAAQFAIYPLGMEDHMSVIYKVIGHAKQSPVWKDGVKTHFCSMLDGNGNQVFDVLRSSFALAREHASNGHVVMTATLTANKNAWPDKDKITLT